MIQTILQSAICVGQTKKGLFFDNDYVTIGYNTTLDALVLQYKRQGKEDEFIEINKKLLEVYQDIKSGKFHVDLRKMGVVSVRGQQFIGEVVLPALVEMSPKKILFHSQLLDKDVFANVAASRIKSTSEVKSINKGQIVVQQFKNEEQAKNWLLSCK